VWIAIRNRSGGSGYKVIADVKQRWKRSNLIVISAWSIALGPIIRRQLEDRGFRVKLIAPQFVKPNVKSNKNDTNDAEAICEAMSRPSMRIVAIKTNEQQDIQAAHRIWDGLIEQRTAKANQIRGLVAEYGLIAPKEILMLRRAIPCLLEDAYTHSQILKKID